MSADLDDQSNFDQAFAEALGNPDGYLRPITGNAALTGTQGWR
ncbi:MAG TPA: hypothetical protein VEJ84_07120 [Acidimicrobiales bacterium]|nr:hypothetical protein [Acidimicrobiales bacterium]